MKKNAFTLIELLAVIVILAIIALIATPIILGIINDSKEQSTKRSAENYLKAVEQAIVRKNLEGEYNPEECKIESGEVTCKGKFSPKYCKIENGQLNCDGVPLEVEIDGEMPEDGTIVLSNGKAINGTKLIFKAYETSINDKGEMEINSITKEEITYKKYNDGDVVYFDIKEGKSCTKYHEDNSITGYNGIYEGDNSTKTTDNQNNCLKFYAFLDDGGEKLNLLLDHNTTATSAWNSTGNNSEGPKTALEELKKDTSDWNVLIISKNYEYKSESISYLINYNAEEYKARLIEANEIAKITGADKALNWDETSTSSSGFYFDGAKGTDALWQTQVANSTNPSKFYWLYDITYSCIESGCKIEDSSTGGYWTSTISGSNSSYAWNIHTTGAIGLYGPPSYIKVDWGVRPVIEVSKSKL